MTAEQVEALLKQVGGIYHPSQIGVTRERFYDTYFRAQMIRSRYTLLDFVYEAGLLEELVDALFAEDGFWGQRPWSE